MRCRNQGSAGQYTLSSCCGKRTAQEGLCRDDAVIVLKSQGRAHLGGGPDWYTSQYNGTRLTRQPTGLVRCDAHLINLMERLQAARALLIITPLSMNLLKSLLQYAQDLLEEFC